MLTAYHDGEPFPSVSVPFVSLSYLFVLCSLLAQDRQDIVVGFIVLTRLTVKGYLQDLLLRVTYKAYVQGLRYC